MFCITSKDAVSDSDDEPQPEYGNIAIVVNPKQRHISPQTINAMMVGLTCHDYDHLERIREREAFVERESSSDEVEARTSINGSLTDDLFGTTDIQKALESGDGTDPQGDAQEAPSINDTAPEQESEKEDSASESDSDVCAAAESEDEFVDETVQPCPMRSKSRKVVIPEALMCSDAKDELPRPQRRKRNHASPAALRAGKHAKYFRRNSNQFSSIASKKLMARTWDTMRLI